MELHREFSSGANLKPNVRSRDQESEKSETLRPSVDVEKDTPMVSTHSKSQSEGLAIYLDNDQAIIKEIAVEEGVVDDKSLDLSLDEALGPLHIPKDEQHDAKEQPMKISVRSSDQQTVVLSSLETSESPLPIFQLHNCHLILPLGFQYRRSSSNSIGSTESASLQWAAVQGNLDVAKGIRRQKGEPPGLRTCQINTNVGGKLVSFDGWTALSLASYFGHLPVVDYFLKHTSSTSADQYQARSRPNPSNPSNPSLLPPLFAAVASVPYLIILNSLMRQSSSSNISPNHDLLKIGDLKVFRAQRPDLWQYPSQTPNSDKDSQLKIIKALSKFEHRAFSMDVQDRHKFNLVQAAACGTSLSAVTMILQLGGKLFSGQKGLFSKLKRPSDAFPDTPLHLAAFWNRTETVKHFVQQKGNRPDVSGHRNRTPLHYAAAMGNVEVI